MPQEFKRLIDRAGYFELVKTTADDLKRNEYYQINRNRKLEEKQYVFTELCSGSTDQVFNKEYLARITQLFEIIR